MRNKLFISVFWEIVLNIVAKGINIHASFDGALVIMVPKAGDIGNGPTCCISIFLKYGFLPWYSWKKGVRLKGVQCIFEWRKLCLLSFHNSRVRYFIVVFNHANAPTCQNTLKNLMS